MNHESDTKKTQTILYRLFIEPTMAAAHRPIGGGTSSGQRRNQEAAQRRKRTRMKPLPEEGISFE
jgi:hypothetical protein